MHATERARRVATVAELEVVRCITSRSDQTGKYFSYNFGVVCPLISSFSCLLFSSLVVCSLAFSSSRFVLSSLFFSSLLFSSVLFPYLPLILSSLLFSSLLVSCRTGWKQRRATAASICRVVFETPLSSSLPFILSSSRIS